VISRDEVLEAARDLAAAAGTGALTMRAIAGRLGVTPMALYRHAGGKDAVLDGLVDRFFASIPPLPAHGTPGEVVPAYVAAVRSAAARDPWAVTLLLTRPVRGRAGRAFVEGVYRLLRVWGVPAEDVQAVERILSSAVLGLLQAELSERLAERGVRDVDYAALTRFLLGGIDAFTAPSAGPAPS
jgi:AcrR family transcriptional regulator